MVFSSVVAVCVPILADGCLIDIEEDGDVTYRIGAAETPDPALGCRPGAAPRAEERVDAGLVRTPIRAAAMVDEPAYRGVVEHRWHDLHRPSSLEVTLCRFIVRMAVAVVTQERLAERVRNEVRVADSLRVALQFNHDIGPAVGIVMATQQVTRADSIALLQRASAQANKKLRDVAAEVVLTGRFDPRYLAPSRKP